MRLSFVCKRAAPLAEADRYIAERGPAVKTSFEYVKLIDQHATVVLTEDLPKQGLRRGQVGTVLDVGPDSCTVEFGDKQGRIFAIDTVTVGAAVGAAATRKPFLAYAPPAVGQCRNIALI